MSEANRGAQDLAVDGTVVIEGEPRDPGIYLMWSLRAGWPVVEIVRVELSPVDGRVVFERGGDGTHRFRDLLQGRLYLGHSRVTTQALAHYEDLFQEARRCVVRMLAAASAGQASVRERPNQGQESGGSTDREVE